ncbi:MAG TPA: sigma-70 family RNA polymerase sigma factor [Candidatus Acidoferrales bacterium]|jgi:RNA polymerase sigma-70 factor (ECF subfamily)|nr:sigma-70 family RNA polymerase sigma factor [Candidatus Acidoferrales bacterium]
MSGDTLPLALPLARLSSKTCEATTLYRELRQPLLRYLVCIGLRADEAQDVVQDAFVSLQKHLAAARSQNESQENVRGWLFRVAHNAARNRQKSFHRRCSEPLDDHVDSQIDAFVDQTTPESTAIEKEKFRRLAKAVRLLTETERECLLLRGGGLRYREIGEVLGLATSTVGDTVERAIRKLAEKCNV